MAWKTTENPKGKIISLRLTEDEDTKLDAYAASSGSSRSQVIRDAVAEFIEGNTSN